MAFADEGWSKGWSKGLEIALIKGAMTALHSHMNAVPRGEALSAQLHAAGMPVDLCASPPGSLLPSPRPTPPGPPPDGQDVLHQPVDLAVIHPGEVAGHQAGGQGVADTALPGPVGRGGGGAHDERVPPAPRHGKGWGCGGQVERLPGALGGAPAGREGGAGHLGGEQGEQGGVRLIQRELDRVAAGRGVVDPQRDAGEGGGGGGGEEQRLGGGDQGQAQQATQVDAEAGEVVAAGGGARQRAGAVGVGQPVAAAGQFGRGVGGR